jgi:hypothetical protein
LRTDSIGATETTEVRVPASALIYPFPINSETFFLVRPA